VNSIAAGRKVEEVEEVEEEAIKVADVRPFAP